MKLEIGKRYVTRAGLITDPVFADTNPTTVYIYRADIPADPLMAYYFNEEGVTFQRGRGDEHERDLVSEYTDTDDIIKQHESRISFLESRVAELEEPEFRIEVGKRYVTRSGLVSLPVRYNNNELQALIKGDGASHYRDFKRDGTHVYGMTSLDLVSLYVEPEPPTPPTGYLLYSKEKKEIAELPLHYTHEHIKWWDDLNRYWRAGIPRHDRTKFYAIKAGSALSYRCKLETLKLEAGKRYVLADGRITMPLCTTSGYADTFVAGLDDNEFVLHYWRESGAQYNVHCTITSPISHPYEG